MSKMWFENEKGRLLTKVANLSGCIHCHHLRLLVSFYFINIDQLVILMSDIKDIICCWTVYDE